ncbi:MAG: tRNA pseudouridine(38-40) synthase TruA [Chlamydiia bacterium]|nr:tRNA pseudouridine(38-40) synthase TruA [Chlamydiia bacterium]
MRALDGSHFNSHRYTNVLRGFSKLLYNIKCCLAYDGRDFYGWQKTEAGPSIESTVQDVIELILQHPVKLQAASRTDRGVHAQGQIINFFTPKELDLSLFRCSCNRLLPPSIRMLQVEIAADDFHPSLSTIGKTYTYEVMHGILHPLKRHTVWSYAYPLDLQLMQKATHLCTGERNFKAFENVSASMTSNTICNLSCFEVMQIDNHFHFELYGNRFLYKMVRNLIGMVCAIGSGQLEINAIESIFASEKRYNAFPCAPAHGLCLKSVAYTNPEN